LWSNLKNLLSQSLLYSFRTDLSRYLRYQVHFQLAIIAERGYIITKNESFLSPYKEVFPMVLFFLCLFVSIYLLVDHVPFGQLQQPPQLPEDSDRAHNLMSSMLRDLNTNIEAVRSSRFKPPEFRIVDSFRSQLKEIIERNVALVESQLDANARAVRDLHRSSCSFLPVLYSHLVFFRDTDNISGDSLRCSSSGSSHRFCRWLVDFFGVGSFSS
jgi:hypothetical protein